MKKQKWWTGLLLGLLSAGSLATTTPALAQDTRTVTDMSGTKVTLPEKVNRVADLWHANNEVVMLLGGQDKLAATTPMIQKQKWVQTIDPDITKVKAPFAGDQLQTEELLKTKPDVVISSDPGQVKAARQAKLPTVNAMYQDFAGLKKSVRLTAQVLGGQAPQVAAKYVRYLDHNIKLVQAKVGHQASRPTVLHIVNPTDLTKVDGQKTIVDEWINLAGGKNAIKQRGNMIQVTKEELLKANPAVIIVGQTNTRAARAALAKDPTLSQLTAVKENKVYANPQGVFPWDRYSGEEALQVLWAAKLLHPKSMRSVDMNKETRAFYRTYYHYDLTKKQAHQILTNQ